MMVQGFAPAEITVWQIALGIGLVVVLVVIALLTLLLSIVHDIDRGVLGVWETAKRLAANTATVWQLQGTVTALTQLKEEALLHDQLLGSATNSSPQQKVVPARRGRVRVAEESA